MFVVAFDACVETLMVEDGMVTGSFGDWQRAGGGEGDQSIGDEGTGEGEIGAGELFD